MQWTGGGRAQPADCLPSALKPAGGSCELFKAQRRQGGWECAALVARTAARAQPRRGAAEEATHRCGMAGVPSGLSGRNRQNTPKSFLKAQCSGLGSQLLNSPMRARACKQTKILFILYVQSLPSTRPFQDGLLRALPASSTAPPRACQQRGAVSGRAAPWRPAPTRGTRCPSCPHARRGSGRSDGSLQNVKNNSARLPQRAQHGTLGRHSAPAGWPCPPHNAQRP